MSKSYGPQAFEKEWTKQLNGFNETKIFFFHDKSKTFVKYINGNKLLGVEMYRSQYEIDHWLGHFQSYLDTGIFDTDAYWVKYKSIKDENGKLHSKNDSVVNAVPMKLKNKVWTVHSPEMDKFMQDERAIDKDLGFKQVPRPIK